jgi:hypothetical protein
VVFLNGSSKGAADAAAGGCTGDSVAATAGTCPVHYGFDIFTKSCTKCDEGWGGPACKQCATDDACKVRAGGGERGCESCSAHTLWLHEVRQR